MGRVWAHVRRSLTRGLLLVLPLVITLWLLGLLFDVIIRAVAAITPWLHDALLWAGFPALEHLFTRLGLPVVGLLLTVLVVYLLGLLAGNLAGRRLVAAVESWILRVPLVKGLYGSLRQLLDAFGDGDKRTFSRVVMIEYPRRGLWTVGFVTSEVAHGLPGADGESTASLPVFLPTTPNPTSGWLILVPTRDMRVLDLTIEDGMKLIVSGGIVSPGNLGERLRGKETAQGSPSVG